VLRGRPIIVFIAFRGHVGLVSFFSQLAMCHLPEPKPTGS